MRWYSSRLKSTIFTESPPLCSRHSTRRAAAASMAAAAASHAGSRDRKDAATFLQIRNSFVDDINAIFTPVWRLSTSISICWEDNDVPTTTSVCLTGNSYVDGVLSGVKWGVT